MEPMAPSLADMLAECQDTVDHVTLEDLTALAPGELVLLELPPPRREGQRYRCLARESLADYAAVTQSHMGVREEAGALRLLTSTYIPGVDFEHRDLEFLARLLESPSEDAPTVLHVARVVEVPASEVIGPHEASAHIHELTEAVWERELWALFDRAVIPAATACPSGHPLRQRKRTVKDSPDFAERMVVCDSCERTLAPDVETFRCAQRCNYDICQDCHRGGTGVEVEDGAAWLKQELEDFWRQRPGFALPRSPPRLGPGSGQLSTAITKWNRFTLDKRDVVGLRQTFMGSLEEHGMDIGLLRRDFWPGCSEQRARAEFYIQLSMACRSQRVMTPEAMKLYAGQVASILGRGWNKELAHELLKAVIPERPPPLFDDMLDPPEPEAAPPAVTWRSWWSTLGSMVADLLLALVCHAPWRLSALALAILVRIFLWPA
uniref:ZZ-type domain-containing protein n=1 Tax=Alexandrium monilatum TaxID=311494 RepID=A0A7S4QR25_9DINO|mmetsp:Transcript_53681/g.166658  ORF Transcript_53681/g.166658 Transcript_53681/m.166658 type:complete len:435 (+) Transcript_53681:69-1373(+)